MQLPEPLEITIPSLPDGIALALRLYVLSSSRTEASVSEHQCKAAVVAHPYAPLGGSFDDPVVLLAAEELFDAGYTVMTFNFRRRTSWTSKSELKDYISATRFLIYFMLRLTPSTCLHFDVVLAGYSYGSMIASQVPPVDDLMKEQSSNETSALESRARELAARISPLTTRDASSVGKPSIETRYLLISPVLPPVTNLLTFSLRALDYTCIKTNSTLAVFGTQDNFTSGKKLRRWAQELGIQFEEIEGAGHFWFEHATSQRLRGAVAAWARADRKAESQPKSVG